MLCYEMRKRLIAGILIGIAIIAIVSFIFLNKKTDFSVNTFFIKFSMPAEGEFSKEVTVANKNSEQKFKTRLANLESIAFLDEPDFILGKDESKKLIILFNDSVGKPMIYSGKLIVETKNNAREIPVLISIEDNSKIYSIIQTPVPNYDKPYPGGKFGMEIKFFNLKDYVQHEAEINYYIKNPEGDVLLSDSEGLVIQNSLKIVKTFDIPKEMPYGNYFFITQLKANNSESYAGDLFSVSRKESKIFSSEFKFFFGIVLVFLAGIFALFFYYARTRDKLLIELKKQQRIEIQRNFAELGKKKEKIIQIKEKKKKKILLKKFNKIKKIVIHKIKLKHKEQRREFKKLRKEKKINILKNKILEWKNQGYNTDALFSKEEKYTKSDAVKFKKQGYKF